MVRRYARRQNWRSNRDKYSKENTGFRFQTPTTTTNGLYQSSVVLVPAVNTQGMRKVKHITVSLSTTAGQSDTEIFWAIVYVPQGTNPNPLFSTSSSVSGSMYEPNQFVMNCGLVDPSAGPIRFRSVLSRNLNSGDSIYLVVGTVDGQQVVDGVASYAITLQ
jgi:hypothetical protein